MKRVLILFLAIWMALFFTSSAYAQDYYFQMPQEVVHVYWNEDGSLSLQYIMVFQNDNSGPTIEYIDLGLPNSYFSTGQITALVDGASISNFSTSDYQGSGYGVAIGLGSYSIPPGSRGTVTISINGITNVLYKATEGENYTSAVFIPSTFGRKYVYGTTDLTVIYHLPPGVQPDEPRWFESPAGFPPQPETGFDENGRITYTWRNPNANGYTEYSFGASFPQKYIPASSIVKKNPFAGLSGIELSNYIPCCVVLGFVSFFLWAIASGRGRRQQYIPPKIFIEGHGIKRGLTAIEAAILLEQPLDKVLTMILFSVIKKNAASVISRDPLKIELHEPFPTDLYSYEKEFLDAFRTSGTTQKKELESTIVNLVKSVSNKVKGFSRKETIEYYRNIVDRAWSQVEASETPEVRSQKFDEVMEWTMLDKNYDDRTRDIFRNQPVYIPVWWGRFDPTISRAGAPKVSASPVAQPSVGRVSLPTLPGSNFAASIVTGVQSFSGKVVGNLAEFTSGVTQKTNPPPVTRSYSGGSRSGGSGCACACACACAGCACACAGGGR